METHLKKPTATSKMKPFVAFVVGFQPLTNVTKNSISVVAGVLDLPLEHYNVLKKLCRCSNYSPGQYVEKTFEAGLECLFFMLSCFHIKIFRRIRISLVKFPKIKIDDAVISIRQHVIYDQNVTSM